MRKAEQRLWDTFKRNRPAGWWLRRVENYIAAGDPDVPVLAVQTQTENMGTTGSLGHFTPLFTVSFAGHKYCSKLTGIGKPLANADPPLRARATRQRRQVLSLPRSELQCKLKNPPFGVDICLAAMKMRTCRGGRIAVGLGTWRVYT